MAVFGFFVVGLCVWRCVCLSKDEMDQQESLVFYVERGEVEKLSCRFTSKSYSGRHLGFSLTPHNILERQLGKVKLESRSFTLFELSNKPKLSYIVGVWQDLWVVNTNPRWRPISNSTDIVRLSRKTLTKEEQITILTLIGFLQTLHFNSP